MMKQIKKDDCKTGKYLEDFGENEAQDRGEDHME